MSTIDPTPRPVRLTAEQTVRLADYAAAIAVTGSDEGIDINDWGPHGLRRRHVDMAPYVELIAELQDELEVTRTVTLRAFASELREHALDLAACERVTLARVRSGERGWRLPGERTREESEQVVFGEIDRALDDLVIADAVLAQLDAGEPR